MKFPIITACTYKHSAMIQWNSTLYITMLLFLSILFCFHYFRFADFTNWQKSNGERWYKSGGNRKLGLWICMQRRCTIEIGHPMDGSQCGWFTGIDLLHSWTREIDKGNIIRTVLWLLQSISFILMENKTENCCVFCIELTFKCIFNVNFGQLCGFFFLFFQSDTLCRVLRDRKWTVGELASITLLYAQEILDDPKNNEQSCLFESLIGI